MTISELLEEERLLKSQKAKSEYNFKKGDRARRAKNFDIVEETKQFIDALIQGRRLNEKQVYKLKKMIEESDKLDKQCILELDEQERIEEQLRINKENQRKLSERR